jgi:hypothetical protein
MSNAGPLFFRVAEWRHSVEKTLIRLAQFLESSGTAGRPGGLSVEFPERLALFGVVFQ